MFENEITYKVTLMLLKLDIIRPIRTKVRVTLYLISILVLLVTIAKEKLQVLY